MNDEIIYLVSSNASKEYMLDALEVLSLPFGMVQHFRYQLRWLDEGLKKKLPIKGETEKKDLKNSKVIICYLYQQKQDNEWKWFEIYPLRTGILMEAFKTGTEDNDIAHFYFKVDKYIYYKEGFNFTNDMKDWESWNKHYAFLERNLEEDKVAPQEESYSAFNKICESLKKEHFKSPKGDEDYYPIFGFIDGLKTIKRSWTPWRKYEKKIFPKYDPLLYKSYYEISEGSCYSLEFRTYFPENPPEFQVIVKSDEKLFSSPPECKVKISSRYTEENCMLISRELERDVYTSLSFETACKNFDGKKPLNLYISLPVKIKRKLLFRAIEVLGDIGFGVGTGSIALAKMLEGKWNWWYWPVIVGYGIWMISKLLLKLLWRG